MGNHALHRRRKPAGKARQIGASVLATAVAATSTLGASLVTAPAAFAAAQNGYVFNDTWTLVSPGSAATGNTLPGQRNAATYSATSQLPMRTGNIGIRMDVKESDATVKGTNYLDAVNNQDYWQANSGTFLGSPTVANLPAIAVETNPSNCGAFDSTQKTDFNGVCEDASQVTITFDKTVTDPILDVSGLGGYLWARARDSSSDPYSYRGGFLQQQWNLVTQGVSLQAPSGTNPSNMTITPTSFKAASRNANGTCYSETQDNAGATNASPRTAAGACGSVLLRGTFDTVTFRIDHDVAPFTAFSNAEYGTGSEWFLANRKGMDGVNGLNATWGESAKLPNNTIQVQNDQAHFSVRLPQTGVIGDRVWNDANGNGIQDDGEPGIQGVTVELLDENGQPVLDSNGNPITTTTDANGAYRFENLPLGKYKVRFSGAPEGMSPTTPGAGADRGKDSNIDASGLSDVVELNTDAPEADHVDAGYTAAPVAKDDESLNNAQGSAVSVPVLSNDTGNLDPSTVKIKDKDGNPVDSLVVPGEGKWAVNPENGDITFTPEDGFTGNPTDIDYVVKDKNGQQTGAKVHVTYKPEASNDESLNNKQGTVVTVPVLKNDKGDLDPSTVKIKDKDGNPVDSLVVPGEGTWTVDPKTGDITFTPEEGFKGNPTDISYTVKDKAGNETGANVHVTYVPEPVAKDDESLNNAQGKAVTVPVLGNDDGDFDPSTVKIKDKDGNPVDSLVVPGEGTWTVDPKTGDVTFTPEQGFTGNPTDIVYTVKDKNGNETGANVHVTYLPEATNDESLNNKQGSPVKVPVLGNDKGDLDPSTVKIKDQNGNPVDSLVVPGEGQWTVDPK
ncbi:SdrD B-like domain-containing protein, partial [Arthrobacter woluwensis]